MAARQVAAAVEQDAHEVAAADPALAEAVGDLVGPNVQLGVGRLARALWTMATRSACRSAISSNSCWMVRSTG